MTNLRHEIIANNIETHGIRWAFDHEYQRLVKAGWWPRNAFALACNAVFHRYIGELTMPTPTIINPTQSWAMTRARIADLRDGFWNFCDNHSLDAPTCLPSGHTVAGEFEGVRYINGGLAVRYIGE